MHHFERFKSHALIDVKPEIEKKSLPEDGQQILLPKPSEAKPPERKGLFKTLMMKHRKAHGFLMAYIGFRHQEFKKKRDYLIPKDKAAWLDYLLQLVKKKTNIEYLSDKELRKVIIRARPNLAMRKQLRVVDPDCPQCHQWTVEQAAEWISSVGFPYLKEAFILNSICGRKLVTVDCSALNQMGMRDLTEMRKVTAKIRAILEIPAPNMLRALMRIPPFEMFLRRKVNSGKTYDALTFEKFCKQEGFQYAMWKYNKNALIPCTCEVRIVPTGFFDEVEDDAVGSDNDDMSVFNAPTVEFVVRTLAARDRAVQAIIENIIDGCYRRYDENSRKRLLRHMKMSMQQGYSEAGAMTAEERLSFSVEVAKALLEEMQHTTDILEDLDLLERYIKAEVTQEKLKFLSEKAEQFMRSVIPIATMMALGQLDLESIFKMEPEFCEFVDSIILEAEYKTNQFVPDALEFVEAIIKIAEARAEDISEKLKKEKGMVIQTLSEVRADIAEQIAQIKELEPELLEIREEVPGQGGRRVSTTQAVMTDFPYLDDDDDIDIHLAKVSAEQIVTETLDLALSLTNVQDAEKAPTEEEVKNQMKKVTIGSLNAAAAINKKSREDNAFLAQGRTSPEKRSHSQPHSSHEEYHSRYPSIPEEDMEVTRL